MRRTLRTYRTVRLLGMVVVASTLLLTLSMLQVQDPLQSGNDALPSEVSLKISSDQKVHQVEGGNNVVQSEMSLQKARKDSGLETDDNSHQKSLDTPLDWNPPINIWRDPRSDRIVEQLEMAARMGNSSKRRPLKTIFLQEIFYEVPAGKEKFQNCPVKECTLVRHGRYYGNFRDEETNFRQTPISSDNKSSVPNNPIYSADAILFGSSASDPYPPKFRSPNQIWIYYNLESPTNTYFEQSSHFNWTATYRRDSTLVAPYAKFVFFPNMPSLQSPTSPAITSTMNKTYQVAWFVSNCADQNGRLRYGRELSKYISVHIYGTCGDGKWECAKIRDNHCLTMLQEKYKFYLSFENSNCRDYITEKFFHNALM